MKSQFETNLEKQVRKEVRAILATLSYGYEFEMSDYASNDRQAKAFERRGKREIKRAEDMLVKLALDMY